MFKLRFGPYQLARGTHSQDEPVMDLRAVARENDLIHCEDEKGEKKLTLQIADDSWAILDGVRHSLYLGTRKVAAHEIKPARKDALGKEHQGDLFTLCIEKTYRAWEPDNNTFWTKTDQSDFFNPRDKNCDGRGSGQVISHKAIPIGNDKLAISEKDARINELERELAEIRAKHEREDQPQQPQGPHKKQQPVGAK